MSFFSEGQPTIDCLYTWIRLFEIAGHENFVFTSLVAALAISALDFVSSACSSSVSRFRGEQSPTRPAPQALTFSATATWGDRITGVPTERASTTAIPKFSDAEGRTYQLEWRSSRHFASPSRKPSQWTCEATPVSYTHLTLPTNREV